MSLLGPHIPFSCHCALNRHGAYSFGEGGQVVDKEEPEVNM